MPRWSECPHWPAITHSSLKQINRDFSDVNNEIFQKDASRAGVAGGLILLNDANQPVRKGGPRSRNYLLNRVNHQQPETAAVTRPKRYFSTFPTFPYFECLGFRVWGLIV
jgi:hypothetical protein